MSNVPNDGLPLTFMSNGTIFSKQVDGYYHYFTANQAYIKANSLGMITIAQARDLFNKATFISSIIVLSDNVYQKL